MKAYGLLIIIALFFSCDTYKKVKDSKLYTGQYYIQCVFFPKNSHLMFMAGLSPDFDAKLLNTQDIDSFQESFYKQAIYTPVLTPAGYYSILKCLGYKPDENLDADFNETYDMSDKLEEFKFTLKDGNYVLVELYRIKEKAEIIYLSDKKCISSNSIEMSISPTILIDKTAFLIGTYYSTKSNTSDK